MSNTHNTKEQNPILAGVIVGETNPSEFYFASKTEDYPSQWEYLVVYSQEDVDGRMVEVPVVAQVENIVSASQALSRSTDIEALKMIVNQGLDDVKTWGKARVLGYLVETLGKPSKVLQPRRATRPGREVHVALKEVLSKFYSVPEEDRLYLGNLITRRDVDVHLSVSGLRRHLAIIAQTGAGKSYCAGVLIEELLALGATIVIIDPHADYKLLGQTKDGQKHDLSDRVIVFSPPAAPGRHTTATNINLREFTVAFSDLTVDEVCEVADISERFKNIIDAVEKALNEIRATQTKYTPKDLIETLEAKSKDDAQPPEDRRNAAKALKYARRIEKLNVFGEHTTPIKNLLQPMLTSVLDLSGLDDRSLDYVSYRVISGIFESVVNGEYNYPVFILIEEAHKLVPPKSWAVTFSSSSIRRIAAEGRKFGVFLILVTQRPSKIDPDALSMCNSQIIMRITNPTDQEAIENSSERMSESLLRDLPGLNTGDAVVVGDMVKAPVMVSVKERRTREGGADIDVIGALKKARGDAKAGEESGRSVGKMFGYG